MTSRPLNVGSGAGLPGVCPTAWPWAGHFPLLPLRFYQYNEEIIVPNSRGELICVLGTDQ